MEACGCCCLVMKRSNSEIVIFLDIFHNFEGLWNTSHQNYCNKNAKVASLKKLLRKLTDAGLVLHDVEALKKKKKLKT